MNRMVLYVVAIVVALTLLLFSSSYQVRFNESAIVTTFGDAGDAAEPIEPGLHFKWPYPIQSVTKYDTRAQVTETRIENVVTLDEQLLDVQVFLMWRIADPLLFFQEAQSETTAKRLLDDRLRSALGVFSEFRFTDLLNDEARQSRLAEVEQRMLANLTAPSDQNPGVGAYGIEPIKVGISRLILPESTSQAVQERMRAARNKLAEDARSAGAAEAARIEAEADAAARKIEEFTQRVASDLIRRGEEEGAKYLAEQAGNEDLAIFLRQLDALVASIRTNATTIVGPTAIPFNLLLGPPADLMSPPSEAAAEGDR